MYHMVTKFFFIFKLLIFLIWQLRKIILYYSLFILLIIATIEHHFLRFFISVRSLSHVWLFATPWTAARGFPVHHQLPEPTQAHVYHAGDAIHHLFLCRPLLLPPSIFPSIRVFFQWVSSLHQVAKLLEFQFQHQYFQWIFRADFL